MEVTKAEGGAGVPEERRENGGRFDWSGFFKWWSLLCILCLRTRAASEKCRDTAEHRPSPLYFPLSARRVFASLDASK
ncbi:unnamed protein product [Miscanthus lutarioriparius]|uniref:Uncharacterized protein n=1 Tax=Miscanthus lutarioriparius TaxID=422564 RepID=A0A811QP31_9POAL|nr:unnamed protein product [Miscanthus lutarioriparius]